MAQNSTKLKNRFEHHRFRWNRSRTLQWHFSAIMSINGVTIEGSGVITRLHQQEELTTRDRPTLQS
jgi:hypothetical protein